MTTLACPSAQLMAGAIDLWTLVLTPCRTMATQPPRVGSAVDEQHLAGMLRRRRCRALAALWPSLSTDQRAATLYACTTPTGGPGTGAETDSPATASDGPSGIDDWMLALLLAERSFAVLTTTALSPLQWQLVLRDPVALLPAVLQSGPAARWVLAGVSHPSGREAVRQAALRAPAALHLPIDLLMELATPWTHDSAHVVAGHPETPAATLRDIAARPGLTAGTRARLVAHPSFPIGEVPTLCEGHLEKLDAALRDVVVTPGRLVDLLDSPIPRALASTLSRTQPAAPTLAAAAEASETVLTLLYEELDVTSRPDFVAAALASPSPAARRALARTVPAADVLARLAVDEDPPTRSIAARRVVEALADPTPAAA